MRLDLRESQSVAILEFAGQLTASGGDEMLREAVDTLVASGRTSSLLDLSNIEFMDSAGVGELVASLRMVAKFGGKLKILNAPSNVRRSLTISKLLPIFEIFDDEEKAVSSYSTAPND